MALPVPFYQDALVTLYNGDSTVLLPQMATRSVDFVITDPPFRDVVDLTPLNNLLAAVTPDLQRILKNANRLFVCQHMQDVRDGVGNIIAQLVTFNTLPAVQFNDPDMKASGWGSVITARGVAKNNTILDPFAGGGGWLLLAAKRLGITSIGIELDSDACARSAAHIAAG